jgi:hypothetical protein
MLLTEANSCPGRAPPISANNDPNVIAGLRLSNSQASAAFAIAVLWSSAVTKGKIGASPHPAHPLLSSILIATFSTLSSLDDAIVNGAIKGTFSGLFSALCTSTSNVSIKFLNLKLVFVAAGAVADISVEELLETTKKKWDFREFRVGCRGEQWIRFWGDENRESPVESIFVCGFYVVNRLMDLDGFLGLGRFD